jgi:predicted NUDIX family NTP pyrophosphohydrolase
VLSITLTMVRSLSMPPISAGLLVYRVRESRLQVLLVHPGGPYFKNKDDGAWSIPKGEIGEGEDLLECAKRELLEEVGAVATGIFIPLTQVKQKGGKIVHAWAVQGDVDPSTVVSNTFKMEWPPKSGQMAEFPEIDRAEFFDLPTARQKINAGQVGLIDQLEEIAMSGNPTSRDA